MASTWGWFLLTRSWFALRGELPWRLMGFLDDAHRRGVLRQAGAVYQFRHARLQDRLAAQAPQVRAGLAPGPGRRAARQPVADRRLFRRASRRSP
jgi:hypothetical protein